MNILFLIIGLALGVVQFIVTRKYTSVLLSSDQSGAGGYLLLKYLIFAVIAVLSGILIFNGNHYEIWLLAGFAAGFIVSAIVNLIVKGGKNRDDR